MAERYALIVANGETPSRRLFLRYKKNAGIIVAADGGLNSLHLLGVVPDHLVGDLDSAHRSLVRSFPPEHITKIVDEYSTDLEKAVVWCIRKGFKEIVVLGAAGKRIDHQFGNLGVPAKFARSARIVLADEHGEMYYVGRSFSITTRRGQVISLLPLSRCVGIRSTGLKYSLKNESLMLGRRDGTSNVATGSRVTIRVRSGHLLLFRRSVTP